MNYIKYEYESGNGWQVEVTSMSSIPGRRVEKFLGNLDFYMIRECTDLRGVRLYRYDWLSPYEHLFISDTAKNNRIKQYSSRIFNVQVGGVNALVHSWLNEMLLLVRAHCRFLGGNALLSFRVEQFALDGADGKNQVPPRAAFSTAFQTLIHISCNKKHDAKFATESAWIADPMSALRVRRRGAPLEERSVRVLVGRRRHSRHLTFLERVLQK